MIKKVILFLTLTFYLNASQQTSTNLLSGDIIFRKESSMLSDLFSQIDKSEYSHIGIIKKEKDKYYVYHMESTGEGSDLKKDKLNFFLKYNEKSKIIRLNYQMSKTKFSKIIKKYEKMNPEFDYKFKLNNGIKKLYCTEFVNRIFQELINKNIYTYLHKSMGQTGITIKGILTNTKMFKVIKVVKRTYIN